MKLKNPEANLYIPDGKDEDAALLRTTHMGIGAHPDDLEILAIHGIGQCYNSKSKWFTGVTVTEGGGKERIEKLAETRKKEQIAAAKMGKYGAQVQLYYSGPDISGTEPPRYDDALSDLLYILSMAQPEVIYVHNIFDKHEAHGAIARLVLDALRQVPADRRPQHVYGCEVWGGLDWVAWDMKVSLEVSEYLSLQKKLLECHKSQLKGKHQYADAAPARSIGNATFGDGVDMENAKAILYALDLMPFVTDPDLTVKAFLDRYLFGFEYWQKKRIERYEFLAKK